MHLLDTRASAAHWELQTAAYEARKAGAVLPCLGPAQAAWTSEVAAERAQAARACAGCPVFDKCRRAGQFEGTGVWGGVDRQPAQPQDLTRSR